MRHLSNLGCGRGRHATDGAGLGSGRRRRRRRRRHGSRRLGRHRQPGPRGERRPAPIGRRRPGSSAARHPHRRAGDRELSFRRDEGRRRRVRRLLPARIRDRCRAAGGSRALRPRRQSPGAVRRGQPGPEPFPVLGDRSRRSTIRDRDSRWGTRLLLAPAGLGDRPAAHDPRRVPTAAGRPRPARRSDRAARGVDGRLRRPAAGPAHRPRPRRRDRGGRARDFPLGRSDGARRVRRPGGFRRPRRDDRQREADRHPDPHRLRHARPVLRHGQSVRPPGPRAGSPDGLRAGRTFTRLLAPQTAAQLDFLAMQVSGGRVRFRGPTGD